MTIFEKIKKDKFVENMINATKSQLVLLDTLTALQQEYEKMFEENKKLKEEVARLKNNK